MQITELLKLTKWFSDNIVSSAIGTKYAMLYDKMEHNVAYGNRIYPFEVKKENLCVAIAPINFQSLIRFLEKLEITDLIGEKGVSLIEDILFRNNLDLAWKKRSN